MSTGHLHVNGFDSLLTISKRKDHLDGGLFLEQGTGIEPASEAWEATIIADIRTLHGVGIIAEGDGKFNHFLSERKRRRKSASFDYTIARIWCLGFAPTD